MGYRLIALDIDGTIRSVDHTLTDRTSRAMDMVREAGAIVTVATGRMFKSAVASTADLGLTSPIVSFQGALVADPVTAEVLWHRPLTEQMAVLALDALDGWAGDIVSYHGDEVWVSKVTPWVEAYSERNDGGVRVVGDLREVAADEPTRLVVVGDEGEIHRLTQRLSADFDERLHVTRSLPQFCEILHPDGGKHRALAWLCGHLGIPEEDTVAFGNGYNDVEMLRWAGLGVAVGDAVPEAMEAADRVAPPMQEDGAAQVLEGLLDQGLIG